MTEAQELERIEKVHEKVLELIKASKDLEKMYPERSFKLDGILFGNIGEVLAAYHYGIKLYKQSIPTHDGEVIRDGRKVQIKITQAKQIVLRENPDYLIVLHLNRETGDVTEIYNGKGNRVFEASRYVKQMNHYQASVALLMRLREEIEKDEIIEAIHPLGKYVK